MKILGDPHLGRRFVNDVPLHRRGERERLIREEFELQLNPEGARFHVNMGDLFDSPKVDYETLLFACSAYDRALNKYPNTQFVVIRGNHDGSRDLAEVTAFDMFTLIMSDKLLIVTDWDQQEDMVFFGWSPDRSAEQVINEAQFEHCTMAFGHWDVDLRSASHNLLPSKPLAARGIKTVYTGHVHLPDRFTRDCLDVNVVGSMVPLAHGEDPTGDWYVTLTRQQLDETDPADLKNKCVRILLAPGESTDVELDCLQLKYERIASEDTPMEVTMDGFDLGKTYDDIFETYNIIPPVKDRIDTRWQETFMRQQ